MNVPLTKKISALKSGDHACLFYTSPEEQFATVLPYIKAGLEQNEKCLYIVDDNHVVFVLEAMDKAGIDIAAALASRAFVINSKHQTYYKGGIFRPDEMIGAFKNSVQDALSEGYRGLRATGEMTWALSDPKALSQLIDYETNLDKYFPSQLIGLCQYNQNRFSKESVPGILQTHRVVIAQGKMQQNKFYIPPTKSFGGRGVKKFPQLQTATHLKSFPGNNRLFPPVHPQVSRAVPISGFAWRA
jgi:chemotaxis family two-component system sensor kinase Cph1